jgi:hypothetical protein
MPKTVFAEFSGSEPTQSDFTAACVEEGYVVNQVQITDIEKVSDVIYSASVLPKNNSTIYKG